MEGVGVGQYADRLAHLELVRQLQQSAGRHDISATDIAALNGLIVEVADKAGPLLSRIPQTFRQYTEHDIGHCCNIIYLMGKFIPKATLERLNGLELAILLLAALLHDSGMVVSDEEKRLALRSEAYRQFLLGHHDRWSAVEEARAKGDDLRATLIEDALLAEYFRRLHPERARSFVEKHLAGRLMFREIDISSPVLQVCESHAWGVHESLDPRRPEKAVNRLDTNRPVYGVPVNLQYLACCLRLGDIMDFDRSRTPLGVYQNMEFTETKSWEEWNKHLQISGWTITEHEVLFAADCKHPAFYVAVLEFLDWIDAELRECRQLLMKEAPRSIAEHYLLHLPPVVDRWKIEMADKQYLAGAFRFQLDYERILQLLMDRSLYPDPSLFLRELLQNALDACRNSEAIAKSVRAASMYTPRIAVWDHSDDPDDPRIVFQDNGIGMSRQIVEGYFMRVGRSYYRSAEFTAERQRLLEAGVELDACSQFGIGILSCFMVADRFEVETYRVGNRPLHITIEGPTKYFTIRLLDEPERADFPVLPASDHEDGPPHHPGTRITLHLRPNAASFDTYQVLDRFAVNVDYDLHVYPPGSDQASIIARRRWEPEQIRLRDFPGAVGEEVTADRRELWSFTGEYTRLPELEANLEEVLAPSPIPLKNYDFSRHLSGTAWLWLLRSDNGGVCPRRGYLRIGQVVRWEGSLPELLARLTDGLQEEGFRSPEWAALLKDLCARLSGNATANFDDNDPSELKAFIDVSESEHRRSVFRPADSLTHAKVSAHLWNGLSDEERRAACQWMETQDGRGVSWGETTEIPREFLLKTYGWAGKRFFFSNPTHAGIGRFLSVNTLPQSVALHGVFLPAGFVRWNPMAGDARRVRLLDMPGGLQIDARGTAAPTPAASRLFVDTEEAAKVVVPFARATLRHMIDLAFQDPNNEDWRQWFESTLTSAEDLFYWPEAVQQEFGNLDQRLKYQFQESPSKQSYLSGDELVQKFGRWVPLHSWPYSGFFYPGVDASRIRYSGNLLLIFRSKRKLKDGTWEVDMESTIKPQGSTLTEMRENWEQEMKE